MNIFQFSVHMNVLNLCLSQVLLACTVPTVDFILFFALNTQPACVEIEVNYECSSYIMYFYSC